MHPKLHSFPIDVFDDFKINFQIHLKIRALKE